MRFILNFIFFGILFFLIWHFLPEAFQTLVTWMTSAFNFVQDLVVNAWHKSGAGAAVTLPPANSP